MSNFKVTRVEKSISIWFERDDKAGHSYQIHQIHLVLQTAIYLQYYIDKLLVAI